MTASNTVVPASPISNAPSGPSQPEYSSTRWWEAYLVRYFVGFVFGCICVLVVASETGVLAQILAFAETLPGNPEFGTVAIAVAFLGVGFCYIASAPITVLHAGRYGSTWFDQQSRFFWWSWIISAAGVYACILGKLQLATPLLVLSIAFFTGLLFLIGRKHRSNPSSLGSTALSLIAWVGLISASALLFFSFNVVGTETVAWWLLAIPVFWIVIGQYIVLVRLLHDEQGYFEFYEKLFVARRSANARDVRDTYTHLREHSNSVFIVVVELALLCFIVAYTQTFHAENSHAPFQWQYMVFFTFVWLIPTVYMWGRANAMERAFSDDHERFSGP